MCEVSFNGSYSYAVEEDSTAVFQLADLSTAQNTKQQKLYIVLAIIPILLSFILLPFFLHSFAVKCLYLLILTIGLRLHEIKEADLDRK